MADLTITAANVVSASGSVRGQGFSNDTILAGKAISKDPNDGLLYLADNNSATAARKRTDGIALNTASPGQPVDFHVSGNLNPGATVAVGTIYVLSATGGGICPAADLASGNVTDIIGVATTTSNINVSLHNSGAATP